MSGWDWIHAGLEAGTYVQARQAQQHLSSIEAAMQSAAHAAEVEAARKALVEAMRNFVFDISRDLQLAEEHIEEYPLQVYIVSKALESRFRESGLSPAVFPEFSDKEYVNNTQRKLSSVVNKSTSKLPEDQTEKADIAVNYLTEMPLLYSAIKAKSSLEQIQATDSEWKSLVGSVKSSGTKRNLGILGLIGSPCLCTMFSLSATDSAQAAGGFVAFVFLIGAVFLLFSSRVNTPRFNELKTKREALQKNLLHRDIWNQVLQKFGGDLPSDQYQSLLDQRIAFLNPILGNEFQNFLNEG